MIVIQPQGSLNLETGQVLVEQLLSLVPQPQNLWVIDLVQVDFMDSSGLMALVTALKFARRSGCRLVLCNMQIPVYTIFELTRLDSVFEIFESHDTILPTAELVLAA